MTLVLQLYNCAVSNHSSHDVHGWAARDSACRSKRSAGNGIKPNIGTVPARMLTRSSLVAIVTALGMSSTSEREKRLPRILHRRCLISRNSCTSADLSAHQSRVQCLQPFSVCRHSLLHFRLQSKHDGRNPILNKLFGTS